MFLSTEKFQNTVFLPVNQNTENNQNSAIFALSVFQKPVFLALFQKMSWQSIPQN